MSVYKFPLTCAPLIGDDQTTGWDSCMNNCLGKKCKKCVPNLDTECGKEVSGSGIRCVPKSCFKECCLPKKKKDKNTTFDQENDYADDYADDYIEDYANNYVLENFPDNQSYRVFIPIFIIVVFIILALIVYFTKKH